MGTPKQKVEFIGSRARSEVVEVASPSLIPIHHKRTVRTITDIYPVDCNNIPSVWNRQQWMPLEAPLEAVLKNQLQLFDKLQ